MMRNRGAKTDLPGADPGAARSQDVPPTPPRGAENAPRSGLRPFLIAVAVGFVFGAADQYLGSRVTLGPWAATVSTTSAPWLALPFAFGCSQVRPRRATALGLVVTFAALAGYFALMWSPLEGVVLSQSLPHLPTLLRSQWANVVGGLLTGPLFGFLGQRWRVGRSWAGPALVAGSFCLEPLARWLAGRLSPPALVWQVEVAAGAALAVLFVVAGVTRDRGVAR
jgi:hypothetical protein